MPTGKKMPPAPLTRAIGLVLRDELEREGLSQAEIGRRNEGQTGYVSQPQLSRIIQGLRGIDVDQLNALCVILDISIVDVIERAEEIVEKNAVPLAPVTRLRPRVGGRDEDADLQEVAHTPKYGADDTDDLYE